MLPLEDFRADRYSQFGEDGVISEILKRILINVPLNNWCCEFGAWDGIHLSNTARLIRESGFSAVLIEADKKKFRDLESNFPTNGVHKIRSYVTPDGQSSLDNLLSTTPIPEDFDFLVIDVDGMDYHIFDSIKQYQPKVICIEFNPTIPNVVDYVQPRNWKVKHGSSARALVRLGEEKGYELVTATHCNLFLVRRDLRRFVVSEIPHLNAAIPHGIDGQYIFSAYDGSILSNKETVTLHWHGIFPISSLQILPKFLIKFSSDYSKFQRFLFRAFHLYKKYRSNKQLTKRG